MLKNTFDKFHNSMRKPDVSMAPLIDMVFLLLIFFVVTTTFTREAGIKVDKAQAATSQPVHRNMMVIAIDKTGRYWYDKRERKLDEAVALVVENNSKTDELNIVIVPDKDSRVEPLVALMDHLRARQITRFSLGTRLAETK